MSMTHEESTLAAHGPPPVTPHAMTLKELVDAHLSMPFVFRRNRHEAAAVAGVEEWLRARGLTGEPGVTAMLSSTRPAVLASYTSPDVDADILRIVANQIAYQFVFDDRAEEVGRRWPDRLLPMLCESVAILRDGRPPTTVLGAALADLYRQVQERCTPAQAARWAWAAREYVHGLLYESVAQNGPLPLRTGLCTAVRSLTAGVEPFYPLYEAAQPVEPAPEELHHPVMRRLNRLSVDAAVWTADLFSAVKEQRAGDMINLALAHQRAHRCSLPAAVTLAVQQINDAISEFESLYAEIEPTLSPAGLGYVDGMIGWIRGCYHWSRTVPRYADTASTPALP
ncbi:(-)-alpha-amorphene synthase [Streptomyces sp. ALI-76-A]|uniref:(-)-alpha-amorphene synthase n=1 Tax=Streptomyces sp. ALI-76-A TaxID=3025736 RepID=UPI00256F5E3B|nr:(-)-alpha-amorphene synthase [Streptomyces sp. ALI-76-A]MDL5200128.1 (-)-alpha-amorphene synthase [Streptomyces sp. ALI-76-A]